MSMFSRSHSNSKSPLSFIFSPQAPDSGRDNGFTFSVGTDGHNKGSRVRKTCSRKTGAKDVSAGNSNNHTTSSSPPLSHNLEQPSESSFRWSFTFPPTNLETRTEEGNSQESPQESGIGGNTKPISPPSALTGVIPCYFEGTCYSSEPLAPIYNTAEGTVKRESPEKCGPDPSSLQIIIVSRILKGIPQNPHFRPLKAYSEVSKHRLITAWDHIFEETVDQIISIQIIGFWVDAKRLWETMEELEKMGYNVTALRRRLVELTDVMMRLKKHRSEISGLKSRAEQHRMEKSRLEFEIVKLRAKVEAEKAGYDHVMAKVAQMEDEIPSFDEGFVEIIMEFGCLVSKQALVGPMFFWLSLKQSGRVLGLSLNKDGAKSFFNLIR